MSEGVMEVDQICNRSEIEITIRKLNSDAILPTKGTRGSAGWDLATPYHHSLPSGSGKLINTGLSIKFPIGTYGQIAPTSGLALKGIEIGGGL